MIRGGRSMKKVIIAVCIVLLVLVGGIFFLNRGNDDVKVNTPKKEQKFKLTYEGIDITPGVEFKSDSLNKEFEKMVIPSCANVEGEDNVYKYDNVEITATKYDTYEGVFSVLFLNDTVATDEGIKIGSTTEEVKKAYKGVDTSTSTYIYEKDDVKVLFTTENDKVISIEYVYMYGMDNEG